MLVSPPELKPWQEETIQYGIDNPYSIYALGMGLGKSACGVITAKRLSQKCLIICPAYLRLKWKDEIVKFAPGATVDIFKSQKQIYKLWDTDYVIISYELLGHADYLFEWAECVIWDEGHFLKNMESKRSSLAHKLLYENSNKTNLILTGTPIVNRVWEFYSLIALSKYNPELSGDDFLDKFATYVDFAETFSYLHEYDMEVISKKGRKHIVTVKNWSGIKNKDLLKKYLKGCYIRIKTEDVLDLPPYQWIDVPVDYKDNDELSSAFDKFRGDDSGVKPEIKLKAAVAAAPFTADYCKNIIDQCLPVVVFTDHVPSCELIAEKLGVQAIHGEMSHEKRFKLAKSFMSGEQDAIVATIGSLSVGHDLYRAHDLVFNDPNWVPGNMLQALHRILRLGQTGQCRFHRISGSYQQSYIYSKIEEKMGDIKAALD